MQPGNFALPTTLPWVRGYFKSYTKEKTLGTPHPSLFPTKWLNSSWIAQALHSTPGAYKRSTSWLALSSPEFTLGDSLDQKPRKLAGEQGLTLRRRQREKNRGTRYNKCSHLATSIVLFIYFLMGEMLAYCTILVLQLFGYRGHRPDQASPRRRDVL